MAKQSFKKFLTALSATCAICSCSYDAMAGSPVAYIYDASGYHPYSVHGSTIPLSSIPPQFLPTGAGIKYASNAIINANINATIGTIGVDSGFTGAQFNIVSGANPTASTASTDASNLLNVFMSNGGVSSDVVTQIQSVGQNSQDYANISLYYTALMSAASQINQSTAIVLDTSNVQVAYDLFNQAVTSSTQVTITNTLSTLNSVLNTLITDLNALPIQPTTIQLGSVLQPINFNLGAGSTVILTDANIWAAPLSSSLTTNTDGNATLSGLSNAVYSYVGQTNGQQQHYVVTSNAGSLSITGSSDTSYTVTGPYNYYAPMGNIPVGSGSTMIVNSSNGQQTVLPNTFTFTDNTAIFDAETDVIITDATFAGNNAGHFNITGNLNTTLTIDIQTSDGSPVSGDAAAITLSNVWTNTGGGGISSGTWSPGSSYLGNLTLMSPTIITDPSAVNIGLLASTGINIGSTQVTLRPTVVSGSDLSYNVSAMYADSVLVIDSTNAGMDIVISNNLPFGNTGDPTHVGYGTVKLIANSHAMILIGGELGDGDPLVSFEIRGSESDAASVEVDNNILTLAVVLDTPAMVQLPSLRLSDGGTVTLIQDLAYGSQMNLLAETPGQSNHTGTVPPAPYSKGTTFNLGSNTLNAGVGSAASSIILSGPLTINTAIDSNGTDYGHFVMYGEMVSQTDSTTTPSTLDLSGVTQLTINFSPDPTFVPTSPLHLSLFIPTNISSSAGQGQIIPIQNTAPTAIFNLLPSNYGAQNGTVIWTYTDGVINSVTAPAQTSSGLPASSTALALIDTFIQNSLQDTTTSATSVSAAVSQLINAILSAPDAVTAAEAAERLVPQASAQAASIEAVGLAIERLATQAIGSAVIDNIVDVLPTAIGEADGAEGVGASAGDQPTHGAWASGFIQKAIQKSYGNTTGYKVQTTGGTFGADTKINDNITIGAAWTATHGIVKHSDALSGNKASTDNNIFSIYGVTTLDRSWIINGSLSGGVAKTKSRLEQRFGTTPTYGSSKHKSKTYAANLQVVKLIAAGGNILLQPTVGISYSQFNDDGYTQTGSIPSQTIAARTSYNVEGLLGGKVLGIYNYNDYTIKPNASAYAHITIKDKQGKIHTSLDATTGTAAVPQSKASAAWYSAGAGLFVTKGAWEAGVGYELQLDKKYVGHQGTLRLRVEF